MASKKTTKTPTRATKEDSARGRPTIPSSHSRRTAEGAKPARTAGAKAGKPARPRPAAGTGAARAIAAGRTTVRSPGARKVAAKRVAALLAEVKERGVDAPAPARIGGKKGRLGAMSEAPATSMASDGARELATAIAIAALDKKAVGIEILDVAGRVDYADFLVVMTGRSERQVNALAQGIEEELKKKGKRPMAIEGLPHASWVIMDYADVVVHVFQDEARQLYDIEGLWMDARRLPVPDADR